MKSYNIKHRTKITLPKTLYNSEETVINRCTIYLSTGRIPVDNVCTSEGTHNELMSTYIVKYST
jgi:hypothetical protein